MLQSMTGYGKAETILKNKKIHIEIKTLNSKNIDISTHITSQYFSKDLEIRAYLTQKLIRGKVDFNLWVEDLSSAPSATINAEVVHAYIEQIKSISEKEGVENPQNIWEVISRFPGIMIQSATSELTDEEWQPVRQAIQEAVEKLLEFREQEGKAVKQKFEEKLKNIRSYLDQVGQYETARIEKIRNNITDGLQSIRNADYDRNRLEQEMIYYIEKLDINEEKQRLSNHLAYFQNTMTEENAQGKKLGFIAQEMGREINTLGSKSNQADMQNLVVNMKDELEQIKEQVLNVL